MRLMTKLIDCIHNSGVAARADFSFVHITDSHVSEMTAKVATPTKDAAAFARSAPQSQARLRRPHRDVCESAPRRIRLVQRASGVDHPSIAPGNPMSAGTTRKEGYRVGPANALPVLDTKSPLRPARSDRAPPALGHSRKTQLDWLKADLEKTRRRSSVIIGFSSLGRPRHGAGDNEDELLSLVAPLTAPMCAGHGHATWNGTGGARGHHAKGLYQGSYH